METKIEICSSMSLLVVRECPSRSKLTFRVNQLPTLWKCSLRPAKHLSGSVTLYWLNKHFTALLNVSDGRSSTLHTSSSIQITVIGMVWSGLVRGSRPDQTICLHKDRFGRTGPTNETAKNEPKVGWGGEETHSTSNYHSNRCHSHCRRYPSCPPPGAFHTRPGDTHKPL